MASLAPLRRFEGDLARARALDPDCPALSESIRPRTRHHGATDRGLRRPHNEDALFADDRLGLFVVCDGVGGRASGEVAAAEAAAIVHEQVRRYAHSCRFTDDSAALVRAALQRASSMIHGLSREHARLAGMSTTASVVLVAGEAAVVGHVGDSRVYQARDGVVRQLTSDHTLRNLQVQRGQVDPRRASAGKSAITRALGLRAAVEVDIVVAPLRAGDRLLLCTDGLSDCFEGASAGALARLLALEPAEAGPAAIAHALRCGGKDNVTALFVEVLARAGAPPSV